MNEPNDGLERRLELIDTLEQAIHCCEVIEAILLEAMQAKLPEPQRGSKLEVALYTVEHVIELLEAIKRKL